jgi:hypothetical protein
MTTRVNDVSIIKMAGARERMVINKNICSTTAILPGCGLWSIPMLIKGAAIDGGAAILFTGANKIALKPIPRTTPNGSSRHIQPAWVTRLQTLRFWHAEVKIVSDLRFESGFRNIFDRLYAP